MSIIYRKTDKGQVEIETRAFRLLPRLRQALILVDGRKTDADLNKLILAEPAATLASLLAEGFIEVVGATPEQPAAMPAAAPTLTPAAAPVAPPVERKTPSVEVIRRDAVRFLNERMGPTAENISLKLERAKSMPEIQPLLVSAAQLLRSFGGNAVAEDFIARFLSTQQAG